MSKPDLILVTGATGKIGSSIARNLGRMGKPLRLLVRDLNKPSGFEKVEKVVGDYSDAASLDHAFVGVSSAKRAQTKTSARWLPIPLRSEVDGTVKQSTTNTAILLCSQDDRRALGITT
jgi:NAD(P)H dehydrogenase (quinone)